MTTTTLPTITHRITYDRDTRDYACYVQVGGDPEQYIGSAASYHEGETTCLTYRRDLLGSGLCIPATELDGVCGDCGTTLDSMGLCGCRTEEPTPEQQTQRDAENEADMDEWLRESDVTHRPIGECYICGAAAWTADNHGPLCPDHAGVLQEYQDDQARYRDAEADAPWAAPINTDDTQLAAAWRAYKAGALLWTDVQAIQASLMPRCADHDRPAAVLLNKRPACPQCMGEAERVAA